MAFYFNDLSLIIVLMQHGLFLIIAPDEILYIKTVYLPTLTPVG